MRFNFKIALLILITVSLATLVILYSICNKQSSLAEQSNIVKQQEAKPFDIDCDINGEYLVKCKRDGPEVFLPFSFLEEYFQVYGKIAGLDRFEWSHSYSKIYHPKTKYDPTGVFMYFENYNVEGRDRMKCVSATDGVPVSSQWDSGGYYYPIQIAQFGLAHYSKNLTEPEPRITTLENGDKELVKW